MLRVKIKDIEFSSPILTASGTYGYGNEVGSLVNVAELGGIVTKSVTCNPREGNPPQRIFETSSGMLNSIGLANVGVDVYCSEKLPFLNKLDTDSDLLISSFTSNELKTIYSNIDKHQYARCYIGHNLYNWSSWKELIINNSQDVISKLPNDSGNSINLFLCNVNVPLILKLPNVSGNISILLLLIYIFFPISI